MNHAYRRHLLLAHSAICVLALLAGCKSQDSAVVQPTATKMTVEITLQNTRYEVSEPLGILIKNTGSTDVYALDGQAACTILQLQQYVLQTKSWVKIDRCLDTVQPHVLVLHPGMSEPFTLAPGSASDPNAWEPGVYRIAITFSKQSDGASAAQVAYSQGFTIPNS